MSGSKVGRGSPARRTAIRSGTNSGITGTSASSAACRLGYSAASITAAVVAAGFTALGHFNAQLVAAVLAVVELLDHRIGELGVIEVDEAKAAADAGVTIENCFETHTCSDRRKHPLQLFLVEVLGQIADVETSAHRGFRRKKERLRSVSLKGRVT